jgi:hypothetical protein
LSRKVLGNIFYNFDEETLIQTRFLREKENSIYREKFERFSFRSNVDQRHSCQSVLFVLSYLEYFFLKDSETPASLYHRASKRVRQNTDSLVNKIRDVARQHEISEESKLPNQMEVAGSFKKMEVGSLFHTVFSSRATQDILFELSKLLSHEILMIMAEGYDD